MNIAAKFLEVQNELNLKLSPEWATKGWAYPDAMFTEATEAYNHLNWEWWRATDRKIDWDQVKLEWVDVAHFMFSEVIAGGYQPLLKEVIRQTSELPEPPKEYNLLEIKGFIKCFIQCTLSYDEIGKEDEDWVYKDEDWVYKHDRFNDLLCYFFSTMYELGLTLEQFYTLFIGKVCLNQLRWKNGYKKGVYNPDQPDKNHYVKSWNGVEDNVWLAEYAATLDPNDAEFKSKLETALDAKYKEVYEAAWSK